MGMVPAPSMGVPAPAPMPKWPANWQSAAFEAVAVKKSYILSPPEIYAECAHHGEMGGQSLAVAAAGLIGTSSGGWASWGVFA